MDPRTQAVFNELSADLEGLGKKPIGRFQPRKTHDIEDNRISIGMQCLHLWDVERTFPYLEALGAKKARVYSMWALTEKIQGQYEFAWLDRIINQLLEWGMKPFLCTAYGNPLYSKVCKEPGGIGHNPFESQESIDAYIRYVGKLAEHYTGRITYFEIWNEPEWKEVFVGDTSPWHVRYAELVQQVSSEIHRCNPEAKIVVGAFARGHSPQSAYDLFSHEGVAELADAVSYHFYSALPELSSQQIRDAWKATVKRYTKQGCKLWMDESGIPSMKEPGNRGALMNMPVLNESIQAKWLSRRMIDYLADDDMDLVAYFRLSDHPFHLNGIPNHYSVLRYYDNTPKPSFYALQYICSLFDCHMHRTAEAFFKLKTDENSSGMPDSALNAAMRFSFVRDNQPVLVYWNPVEVDQPSKMTTVSLEYWLSEGARFKRPVFMDMVTGLIYHAAIKGDDKILFGLPFTNYPILVTEYELVML